MKVLVCGSRTYDNIVRVYATLDGLHASHRITLLIHGDATGAAARARGGDQAVA